MYRKHLMWIVAALFVFAQGCSSSGDSGSAPLGSAAVGAVQVSLTDAPAYGYDHVWITVKDLWFNTAGEAAPEQAGWYKFPLAAPVTLDLLDLSNGAISVPVWDGIELPEGTYQQIRVLLAPTEDVLAESATGEGLQYNNQVNVTDDATAYPLRIPDARRGIRLEGSFEVKQNGKLKIALDFDAGHDVVKMDHDGTTEYILKPRLASFDLDNAGAIIGHIDGETVDFVTAQFVIKAEQPVPVAGVHLVRRATFIADPETGLFVLYPLLPGNYDVLIRGIGYQTTIIKNVPVTKGTTPQSGATEIPVVTLTASSVPDYPVNASIVSPTGAWVDFYQTVSGDLPYQVRFRHFHPLTGQFAGFLLSSDPLRVGTYVPSGVSFTTTTPEEGNGGFKAEAMAVLHRRSGFVDVNPGSPAAAFSTLTMRPPATARSISGNIVIPEDKTGLMDRGVLFAVHGGMIVNAMQADGLMDHGGGYTLPDLPGGTPTQPLPMAFYGITALGWKSDNPAVRSVAVPRFVDLRVSDAAGIDLDMVMLQSFDRR